ncbi:MAG: three-Cys-motif partner protein TcmP [Planctomycetaceae bacterium]|jgi:three-Cys-motif partner protein|nr:three-Cys-motif partner protein TcmP [Planctomycetaceae bacterium]
MSNNFFDEQEQQSLVKATITSKYFDVWAGIITNTQNKNAHRYGRKKEDRIAYIDLFAGPGRYKNGSTSTPLMILEKAIKNKTFRERLVTMFNDMDASNTKTLQNEINALPDIHLLKHKPDVRNEEVGDEIVQMFESMKVIPTLFFVDPWGYKGLSLKLINSVVKDWGCDAIFFFNYNRINMGLNNPNVKNHMEALFEEQFDTLVSAVKELSTNERELQVIESLYQAIKGYGTRFTLPFRFKNENGNRTSHHLIFVSKHFKGYDVMKNIMYKESTNHTDGVASFEYNPRELVSKNQPLLFKLSSPLSRLKKSLINEYHGQTIKLSELYESHSIDRPFVLNNYKDVLKKMYEESIITARSDEGKPPRQGTFSEKMNITFLNK